METTQRWPVDFDAVKKGDSWSPAQLEGIIGKPRGTDAYRMGVLKFCQRVADELADRDRPATVAEVKGHVRVLTDPEASEHNARSFSAGFRRAKRSFRRTQQIDAANLDAAQQERHTNRLAVFGGMLQAAAAARRLPPLTPTVRRVPQVPVGEKKETEWPE